MTQQEQPIFNTEQQTQQQSKAPSKGPTKKLNSYTYWVDEKNKSRDLPIEQRPQKIDPPKTVTQKVQDGRSDWNKAGTWEHRKIGIPEIQKQYTEKLNQWLSENCPEAKIKKVSLNGECEVIFTRNKKALTYEINGKVEFQKKLQEENTEEKSQKQNQNIEPKDQSSSGDDKSDDFSTSGVQNEEKKETKPKQSKQSKSKSKSHTMTFEIVDLTDHGDRDHKSKADTADDKKFIAQKSQSLLVLLEEILKSYK